MDVNLDHTSAPPPRCRTLRRSLPTAVLDDRTLQASSICFTHRGALRAPFATFVVFNSHHLAAFIEGSRFDIINIFNPNLRRRFLQRGFYHLKSTRVRLLPKMPSNSTSPRASRVTTIHAPRFAILPEGFTIHPFLTQDAPKPLTNTHPTRIINSAIYLKLRALLNAFNNPPRISNNSPFEPGDIIRRIQRLIQHTASESFLPTDSISASGFSVLVKLLCSLRPPSRSRAPTIYTLSMEPIFSDQVETADLSTAAVTKRPNTISLAQLVTDLRYVAARVNRLEIPQAQVHGPCSATRVHGSTGDPRTRAAAHSTYSRRRNYLYTILLLLLPQPNIRAPTNQPASSNISTAFLRLYNAHSTCYDPGKITRAGKIHQPRVYRASYAPNRLVDARERRQTRTNEGRTERRPHQRRLRGVLPCADLTP
ncbi:hypothetical protein C8R43DRAFT_1236378 [Mycena crocata]|nr:hypothetical protein C8R43DRAFT_1236378 [Mycena crocata]